MGNPCKDGYYPPDVIDNLQVQIDEMKNQLKVFISGKGSIGIEIRTAEQGVTFYPWDIVEQLTEHEQRICRLENKVVEKIRKLLKGPIHPEKFVEAVKKLLEDNNE